MLLYQSLLDFVNSISSKLCSACWPPVLLTGCSNTCLVATGYMPHFATLDKLCSLNRCSLLWTAARKPSSTLLICRLHPASLSQPAVQHSRRPTRDLLLSPTVLLSTVCIIVWMLAVHLVLLLLQGGCTLPVETDPCRSQAGACQHVWWQQCWFPVHSLAHGSALC